jgi:hypothetical protein
MRVFRWIYIMRNMKTSVVDITVTHVCLAAFRLGRRNTAILQINALR